MGGERRNGSDAYSGFRTELEAGLAGFAYCKGETWKDLQQSSKRHCKRQMLCCEELVECAVGHEAGIWNWIRCLLSKRARTQLLHLQVTSIDTVELNFFLSGACSLLGLVQSYKQSWSADLMLWTPVGHDTRSLRSFHNCAMCAVCCSVFAEAVYIPEMPQKHFQARRAGSWPNCWANASEGFPSRYPKAATDAVSLSSGSAVAIHTIHTFQTPLLTWHRAPGCCDFPVWQAGFAWSCLSVYLSLPWSTRSLDVDLGFSRGQHDSRMRCSRRRRLESNSPNVSGCRIGIERFESSRESHSSGSMSFCVNVRLRSSRQA